jgi:hypothetical protein
MTGDIGASLAVAQVYGVRVRRLRLHGGDRTYDVDFRGPQDSPRPLSVIAGAFSTGKTTILEFVDYCLGANDHPRHPEIMPKVRAAILEVELSGSPYLIERSVGDPSTFAYVRSGRLDEPGATPPVRCPLRPAGHPDSLSSMLLSHCKLEGVRLRDIPMQTDSDTDPLSFRDLMWLCYLPNERLDNKNLLFENSPMRQLKLRQVVDVVFDVHDDWSVELGRRIRAVETELATARTAYVVAQQIVDEQQLGDPEQLQVAQLRADAELADTERALANLDQQARAATGFAEELRERHRAAALDARRTAAARRDGEAQLQRMIPLRASYAADVSKLTMLAEARKLFDPLRVTTCPACLTPLRWSPVVSEHRCTMCQAETGDQRPADGSTAEPEERLDVGAELRSAKARLVELTAYLAELEHSLPTLRGAAERARQAESLAATEVDIATAQSVTPYLAQRDALARRRENATAARQRAEGGLRLIQSLRRRADHIARQESVAASLREELADGARPRLRSDRSAVIRLISERYREILIAWRYPKLADAHLADDLTPYVRGKPYTAASSGGRTLIALAWQLALFEIAWETRSSHPGFLLLDSPQKNLGQTGEPDTEFADSVTIGRIYRHLYDWLAGRGAGAQIVVTDDAPPPETNADVILRFSGRPDQPPYGLIDDETG